MLELYSILVGSHITEAWYGPEDAVKVVANEIQESVEDLLGFPGYGVNFEVMSGSVLQKYKRNSIVVH